MRSSPDSPVLLERLAALGDLARLRTLRLLERQELSVGELAKALQLPQSTVSRHLKLLHKGGWIVKRSAGTASLYRLIDSHLDVQALELWRLARQQLGMTHTLEDDDARLAEVLAERREDSRTFFGRVGSEWDHVRKHLFGGYFTAEALVGLVSRDWVVADVGGGTGNAAEFLAPFVRKVIVVDREAAMLDAARRRLADFDNVEFLQGDLSRLPLPDASLDAAVVALVLHHVEKPEAAIRETARLLKPGGVLLVIDMVAHDRDSYRHTMGHRHLGFESEEIRGWSDVAGLEPPIEQRLRPDMGAKGPGLFVATFRKPT